jgi:hypothetical protein
MKPDYFRLILEVPKSCDEFREETLTTWFTKDGKLVDSSSEPDYYINPKHRQLYDRISLALKACQIIGFESLDNNMNGLESWILETGFTLSRQAFEIRIKNIGTVFSFDIVKEELEKKIGSLNG